MERRLLPGFHLSTLTLQPSGRLVLGPLSMRHTFSPSWVRTETGAGGCGESVKAQNREVVLKEGLALAQDSPSFGVPAWAGKTP